MCILCTSTLAMATVGKLGLCFKKEPVQTLQVCIYIILSGEELGDLTLYIIRLQTAATKVSEHYMHQTTYLTISVELIAYLASTATILHFS